MRKEHSPISMCSVRGCPIAAEGGNSKPGAAGCYSFISNIHLLPFDALFVIRWCPHLAVFAVLRLFSCFSSSAALVQIPIDIEQILVTFSRLGALLLVYLGRDAI